LSFGASGADVTGVCSTTNVDSVRSIGADRVIDYAQDDFTRDGKEYDLITHRKKAIEAEVRRHVKTCVDEFCGRLNRVETIKDFRVLDHNRLWRPAGLC